MKNRPLGIPLAVAALSTIGTLAIGGKQAHVICGAVWTGLSILHGWQYRRQLKKNLQGSRKAVGFFSDIIPTSKLDVFIRSVDVTAYIPGRIRLRTKSVVGNASLARKIYDELTAFKEIDKVDINIVTGSILIQYQPEILQANKQLAHLEKYIMTHVKRGK